MNIYKARTSKIKRSPARSTFMFQDEKERLHSTPAFTAAHSDMRMRQAMRPRQRAIRGGNLTHDVDGNLRDGVLSQERATVSFGGNRCTRLTPAFNAPACKMSGAKISAPMHTHACKRNPFFFLFFFPSGPVTLMFIAVHF